MTMDYGPDWPPRPGRPKRRRRLGFSTRTSVWILLGAFVVCMVAIKLSDRPMRLDSPPEPAAATSTAAPHRVAP